MESDRGPFRAAALVSGAKLVVSEGAPHAVDFTHKDRLNQDLLEFVRT
jgi:pimeloyl-ACP methyl ester carboxylesterase